MYCISSLKVARLAITVVEINSVTVFQVHEQSWNLKLRPELLIAGQNFSRILHKSSKDPTSLHSLRSFFTINSCQADAASNLSGPKSA